MDWFVVLAPLLLLPIVFLFFIGCSSIVKAGSILYELTVTLEWKPPLKADVNSLEFRAVAYVANLPGATAKKTADKPNEGQNSREVSVTLGAWSDDPNDVVTPYDLIGCDVACVLFDPAGNVVGTAAWPPKEGTLAADGSHWCFHLEYSASSGKYSISETVCPQGS